MSDRFGTFMFIPGENRDVRSVQLTRSRLAGLLSLGAGGAALVLALALFAMNRLPGVGPGTQLATENERLRGELGRVEGRVETLSQELEQLLDREEELRLAADLPPVPVEVQAVGVGGPGSLDDAFEVTSDRVLNNRVRDVSTSLDMLLRRSDLVASSFEDARAAIAANHAKLEATPSIWPTSGFLSSTFSMHRRHPLFNEVRPHYGIDISARRGNPIVATAGGRVTEAGWKSGHGNYVEIDHGDGLITTYSHCSRLLVKTGQRVERGDAVALVGSTGFSIAPHVHYEVHEKGQPVDPLKYIFPDAIAD
ncbi:MAG: M23 family metallopeptidase [Gemmatimonadota bacterium]